MNTQVQTQLQYFWFPHVGVGVLFLVFLNIICTADSLKIVPCLEIPTKKMLVLQAKYIFIYTYSTAYVFAGYCILYAFTDNFVF